MNAERTFGVLALLVTLIAGHGLADSGGKWELANAAYRLSVECVSGQVRVTLNDRKAGFCIANGPYLYRAQCPGNPQIAQGLEHPKVEVVNGRLTIRGTLAGLGIQHRFDLPPEQPIMEERIAVCNHTTSAIALSDLQTGLVRTVTDGAGRMLPELANDRFVAVPFRAKPDEVKPNYNDFSIADVIARKGYEIRVSYDAGYERAPADRRQSEGWAWTHGPHTLGIFKFDQQNMQWSILANEKRGPEAGIRFGGACMIDGEPADLGRIQPGQTVNLGVTRYQTVAGGYENAMYAFRAFLDEKGCRFPKGFNPPVHWEQLYDMEGAWDDRPHRYTKAVVEREAEKGVAYSCEALYLDPGWDTGFATFLWGEQWLGPRKAFVDQVKSKYGLKVSLHTPVAPWMSLGQPMGPPTGPASYPAEAIRKAPVLEETNRVPALDRGRRNLAMLPNAKAQASSVFVDGANPFHKTPHLNDGWYGNRASWIAKGVPCWAEIDLGAVYRISAVRLSNDVAKEYSDRTPVDHRVLVAAQYSHDSEAPTWKSVASVSGEPLLGIRDFSFGPCDARWVRVQILRGAPQGPGEPRLDEIEVYEDSPLAAADVPAWQSQARRGPSPDLPRRVAGRSTICIGSKAYLDEATRRLLENCADGVVYLMYDGTAYQGGCQDPTHGHPVPFTKEDHIRACVELARRVHQQHPQVLIEMHDMLMGGCNPRNTPVYYKYGLPGSYDENWGFELMWDPMADIKSGRARSLYYYNLGCNVPVYLHIDLRKDVPGLPVFWWYASTCRHLGIGGTHKNPDVVSAQKAAMRTYRKYDRYFKRGEFYGIDEGIHLHVLPEENGLVVNLFNLSDQKRIVGGSIELGCIGLTGSKLTSDCADADSLANGVWTIRREMAPWATEVFHVHITP